MVEFSKKDHWDYFHVTMEGDKSVYIETIKSLLTLIHAADEDVLSRGTLAYTCFLIEALLPDYSQVISVEDAELLKEIKQKRKIA